MFQRRAGESYLAGRPRNWQGTEMAASNPACQEAHRRGSGGGLPKQNSTPTPTDVLVPHPQLAESRQLTNDARCQ